MRNRIISGLALLGILAGLVSAYFFSVERKAQAPVLAPPSSSYQSAIYSNGIVESSQPGGSNIPIYPEVSGPISHVFVHEGQTIAAGTPLFRIDDSVQQANVKVAEANLQAARSQYDKRRASYALDPASISRDALDIAKDSVAQTSALAQAARALLRKYSLKAPVDGVVLAVNTAVGSYVSPQGAYNAYTQGFDPLLILSGPQEYLAVRCYVDEILVARLPAPERMRAEMSLRGTETKIPLEFVRIQPYVSPKIQLSNQRQERVDLRVLPVIFRFSTKNLPTAYPGQLVDVFIGEK